MARKSGRGGATGRAREGILEQRVEETGLGVEPAHVILEEAAYAQHGMRRELRVERHEHAVPLGVGVASAGRVALGEERIVPAAEGERAAPRVTPRAPASSHNKKPSAEFAPAPAHVEQRA